MEHLVKDELDNVLRRVQRLREALKLTEFGFNHSRCPVCAGWGVGPYGETDRAHTADCPVAKALADEQRDGDRTVITDSRDTNKSGMLRKRH